MAQKVQVILTDDIDGSEAEETVRFGLDGVEFEIDLTTAHATELRDSLAKFIDAGRKLGRSGQTSTSKREDQGGRDPAPANHALGRIQILKTVVGEKDAAAEVS